MRSHLVVATILFTLTLAGCTTPPAGHAPRTDVDHFGVHLSPRSYQGNELENFYIEAQNVGDTLAWAGDWFFIANDGSAPDVIAEQATALDMESAIIATFFRPADGQTFLPLNDTTRGFYVGFAGAFAGIHQPTYMGLGIDINLLHERNRTAYDDFVSWYPDAYRSIKANATDTMVFPVFQYERLLGYRGGLDEAPNATTRRVDPQWGLLEDFPDRDAIGFTTYPGVYLEDPKDMGRRFYDPITEHTDDPIVFSEIGWHAAPWPEGWESSVDEQARFMDRFLDTAPSASLMLWTHLYDQDGNQPYDTMGLIDNDRTPRPAWHRWQMDARPDLVQDS